MKISEVVKNLDNNRQKLDSCDGLLDEKKAIYKLYGSKVPVSGLTEDELEDILKKENYSDSENI